MGLDSQCWRGMKVFQRCRKIMPPEVLQNARGLMFITEVKGGVVISANIGRGFLIKRLSKYKWGYPSSVMCLGIGAGGQVGGEKIDLILVINDDHTMKALESKVQFKLGGEYSVAGGLVGRDGQVSFGIGGKGAYGIYSYSHSQGAFVGVSLEGSFFCQNRFANKRFYKKSHSISSILNGAAEIKLVGQAINTVTELQTFLYELEQGQVGSFKAKIIPLDEKAFDEVAGDVKRFENRRKSFKSTLQSKRFEFPTQRMASEDTILSEDEDFGDEDTTDGSQSGDTINNQNSEAIGDPILPITSEVEQSILKSNSQYVVDLLRMKDTETDEINLNDDTWLQRHIKLGPTLVLKCDHLINENDPTYAEHYMISCKQGDIVTLLDGSLEKGLPLPYQDYVMVYLDNFNAQQPKIGRVSRFCLEPYSSNPFTSDSNPFTMM